jgi:hypothetical protein
VRQRSAGVVQAGEVEVSRAVWLKERRSCQIRPTVDHVRQVRPPPAGTRTGNKSVGSSPLVASEAVAVKFGERDNEYPLMVDRGAGMSPSAGIPGYGHPGLAPPHYHQPTYPGTQQQPMAEQQLANPQVTLMLVNVPPNVHTGEQMVVMTPTGQQYMVIVPQGAGPGSQFQIAVPRSEMVPSQYPHMVLHQRDL